VPRLKGPSFVDQVLEKAQRGETIEAVADCKISPAYTLDVAKILANLLLVKDLSGMTFYLSNVGSCTYYEFALEIVKQAGFQSMVVPVENSNPLRPRDVSVKYQIGFRTWQEALKDYLTWTADSRVAYNFGGKGEYAYSGE
jgi:dTDP-4-dehydrorhamnose reductase